MNRTMSRLGLIPFLSGLVAWFPYPLISISTWSAEPSRSNPDLVYAERALRENGAATDANGLLAFLRARTLTEAQRRELVTKVRALGSAQYSERETASRELIALGRAALPYLRPAVEAADLETSRRARSCIEQIQRSPNPSLVVLAALLIKDRQPAGCVPVLLDGLQSVEDSASEEIWLDVLRNVGWRDGRADPALLAALTAKRPLSRAAAAHVLGRAPDDAVRGRVVPLLADVNARVRFEAAAALARFGNKKAVSVLIALLDDGPFSLACQAEHLLRILGEEKAPSQSLDQDEMALRRRCRIAWEAWWQKESASVDLSRLKREEPARGLTAVCEAIEGDSRVWAWGQGGQPCWEIPHLEGAHELQILPGGRVLVAEHDANRVTERDHEGKIYWEQRTATNPISCQRLANGNTLIATYKELIEVTRDHERVFQKTDRRDFRDALRLPNGHILYVTGDGVLVEWDAKGERVCGTIVLGPHAAGAKYRARVEPLLNGRYLLTLGGSNRVLEIDDTGKVHWEKTFRTPMSATRLHNGHTLIACLEDHCIVEVDRAGKEISKQPFQGRPFAVRRY